MANIPYLGSKISLISKSEIRYEGILYTIDAKESTVTLAKVHSLGTEGRPTERPVAPRDEVYEYIIFRAGDIKDLHVCEPPKALHGLPHDPAIVQHSPPIQYSFGSGLCGLAAPFQAHYTPSLPHLLAHYNNASSSSTHPRKNATSDAGVQTMEQQQRVRSLPQQQRGPMPNRRTDQARRGIQRRGMRGRSGGSRPDLLQFEGEYDFEQANQEFQQLENKLTKTHIEDNSQADPAEDDKAAAYDRKKSFFDEISCEAIQRSKGLVRFDWRVERKLNVETFGVMANNAWMRRRRIRGGGPRRNFRSRQQPQKTVTFDETPSIQELEPESTEQPPLPVIEVIVEKEGEKDWPVKEGEKVWK